MNAKNLFFLSLIIHGTALLGADKPLVPSDIWNKHLIFEPFFCEQCNQIYDNKMKKELFVDTVSLAFQIGNDDFLAAVEMKRFFHNPQLVERIIESKSILVIDCLKQSTQDKHSILRQSICERLIKRCVSFYNPRPLFPCMHAIDTGEPISTTVTTCVPDITRKFLIAHGNERYKKTISLEEHDVPHDAIEATDCIPFEPIETVESQNNNIYAIPHNIIPNGLLHISSSTSTCHTWDPQKCTIYSLNYGKPNAIITTYFLKSYCFENYLQQLTLCSIVGLSRLIHPLMPFAKLAETEQNTAQLLIKCVKKVWESDEEAQQEHTDRINNNFWN